MSRARRVDLAHALGAAPRADESGTRAEPWLLPDGGPDDGGTVPIVLPVGWVLSLLALGAAAFAISFAIGRTMRAQPHATRSAPAALPVVTHRGSQPTLQATSALPGLRAEPPKRPAPRRPTSRFVRATTPAPEAPADYEPSPTYDSAPADTTSDAPAAAPSPAPAPSPSPAPSSSSPTFFDSSG